MSYAEPIFAADFPDFEAYVAAIQKEWDAQWARIYAADWAGMHSTPIGKFSMHLSHVPWQQLRCKASGSCARQPPSQLPEAALELLTATPVKRPQALTRPAMCCAQRRRR